MTSDGQNKLSILSALAKMHTVNGFQGCFFFKSSSQYVFIYSHLCGGCVERSGKNANCKYFIVTVAKSMHWSHSISRRSFSSPD